MAHVWETVKRMLRGHVGIYVLSYVFQLLMCLCSVFSTFLTSVLVDSYMGQLSKAAFLEKWVAQIVAGTPDIETLYQNTNLIGFWVLGSAVVLVVVSMIRMVLRARVSSLINRHMQDEMYDHLLALPFSYYKQAKPGDLIQTCTQDVDTIRKFLIMQTSQILYSLWMLVFCLVVLFQIHVVLALSTLVLMVPLFIFSFFFIKKVRKAYRAADDAEAQIVDRLNDNLSGVRVIKAFSAEQKEIALFEKDLLAYQKVSRYDRFLESFFFSFSDIFIFFSRTIAVVAAVALCFEGLISGGSVAISFTFVNMMVWPLRDAAQTMSAFGQVMAASDRIQLLLCAPLEDIEEGDKAPLKGDIVFEHVSFHYPDDPDNDVVRDVSFHVPAGSTCAIMGKTGSGKSTLYALLTRLYETTGGSILFDGVDSKTKSKRILRQDVASVLQDPFLFSRSIEDNIRIAVPEATHASVEKAARTAEIDDAILHFDQGYETPVGEKGVTLSGGQRQRVAIARALLPNAPIIVFDDSLSAVDAQTDLAIRKRLETEAKGATKIIITHRINTAKDANQILVMDDGRVIESGTHEELLARNGLYAEIARIQCDRKEDL